MRRTIDTEKRYHIVLKTPNGNIEKIFSGDFNTAITQFMHDYKFTDIVSVRELSQRYQQYPTFNYERG